jgi:hypothetical protein
MPKKSSTQYFLQDDGRFDYSPLVNPASQAAMLGYRAIGWDVSFAMTGRWQGENVFAITTQDKEFNISKEVAQGIQLQHTWEAGEQLPWLWEANQGQQDTLNFSFDYRVPVSVGDNLRMVIGGYRFEDILSGQRIWFQFQAFDSQNVNRPLQIYRDPHTGGEDIVIQAQINKARDYRFDFSRSDEIRQNAFTDYHHVEVGMTRQTFTDYLIQAGVNHEAGYWSLIQAMPFSVETASFEVPKWGIGDDGAIQVMVNNVEVWDG